MATEWYCTVQGNISGPHTAAEVRAQAGRGDLTPDSLLRRGTDSRWVRADSVSDLKFSVTPASQVQPQVHLVTMPPAAPDDHPTTENYSAPAKYPALAALAGWYRFLAVVSGLAAAAGVTFGAILANQINGSAGPGIVVMGGSVVWGVLSVVCLLALAEGIGLMRDVELTLREIRDRLPSSGGRRQRNAVEPN